jgi:hypothetical protein
VIVLDGDGVHIQPSPNIQSRLTLAVFLMVAWNVFWVMLTIRRFAPLVRSGRGAKRADEA